MKRIVVALLVFGIPSLASAEPQVIEKGRQPVLQEFLTKHGILNAPNEPKGASPIYAKDYNEVSPYPAHDRVWSFERGGYVLATSVKKND